MWNQLFLPGGERHWIEDRAPDEKNKKLNGFVGKISLVSQLEKTEFFVLTLRQTHPTGYK